jgi:glucose/arabinose dehydrogenase
MLTMKNILLISISLFLFISNLNSQPVITFTSLPITGLSSPLDIVSANDGTNRIFIAQRGGTVRAYDNNFTLLNSSFLTLTGNFTTGGERGLLSIAFHPDYENNRYFFVYYTNGAGGVNIDRFQTLSTDPNQADATTRTNILTIVKPVVYSNHNGGKLNFGADGNLYFGLGDSGSGGDPGNLAQNGNSLWGKMVRINVDNFMTSPFYTIPIDNPFVTNQGVLDEVFSLGLRNPYRWSFDKLTGNTWIADVGQDVKEEVNNLTSIQASGANYGWRCYEGLSDYNTAGCLMPSNYTFPIFDYIHNITTGGFSITGGYVYRGAVYPAMYGYYICADYVSGNVWVINASNNASTIQTNKLASISGFGEKENGELLAITLSGTIYNVTTSSVLPVKFENLNGFSSTNYNQLNWQTRNEIDLEAFEIEYSSDGILFEKAGIANAKNQTVAVYSFQHFTSNKNLYYRLKIKSTNGKIEYSNIIKLINKNTTKEQYIFPLNGNSKQVWLNVSPNEKVSFQLYNFNGQMMLSIPNYKNNSIIDLQNLPTGIYIGKLIMKDKIFTEKFLIGN